MKELDNDFKDVLNQVTNDIGKFKKENEMSEAREKYYKICGNYESRISYPNIYIYTDYIIELEKENKKVTYQLNKKIEAIRHLRDKIEELEKQNEEYRSFLLDTHKYLDSINCDSHIKIVKFNIEKILKEV